MAVCPRSNGFDGDVPAPHFFRHDLCHRFERSFGCHINTVCFQLQTEGAARNIYYPASISHSVRCLAHEVKSPLEIYRYNTVECLVIHITDFHKLINPSIIDQNINPTEIGVGQIKYSLRSSR